MNVDDYSIWWLVGALCFLSWCEACVQLRRRDDDEDQLPIPPPTSASATASSKDRLIDVVIEDELSKTPSGCYS